MANKDSKGNGGKVGAKSLSLKPHDKSFQTEDIPGGRPSGGFTKNPAKFRHSKMEKL